MRISRIYRLLRIITMLQSGRNYTPDELAEELEVSRRTIFRDLNVLEMARIPYFFDPQTKGYRINGRFFLPPINLDLPEALAVLVVTSRLRGGARMPLLAQAARAAMKIESALPTYIRKHAGSVLENFAMRIGPLVDQAADEKIFDDLVGAIARKRICRVVYRSFTEAEPIQLKLHPYQLAFLQRAWYVLGHSQMHQQVRTLKLARIERIFVSSQGFDGGDEFDLDEHFGAAWNMIPEGRLYDVHLHFRPKVAANVAEVLWHRSQRIEQRPDGSIDFHARVDGIGEISWWILGYGDQVEVLGPPELRSRIAETVSRMAAIYAEH